MPKFKNQDLPRRYLLGDLEDEIPQKVEEEFMTDESSLEELEAAESDLIDDYLAGRLTSGERSRFEQHFLSTPERQQKLKFARAFHRYAGSNRPAQVPRVPANWFSLQTWSARVAVAAIVVMVIAGLWLFNPVQRKQPAVATITLSLTSTNRAEAAVVPKVDLTSNETVLRITLQLPKVPTRYRAAVESENGEAIPAVVSAAAPTSLTIDVAATRLKPGQYVVRLFAENTQGVYERVPGGYFFSVK